jgi:hypothetical protein
VVGDRPARVGVDHDPAGLDDDMTGGQDLGGLDLQAVEPLQLQLPQMLGRFLAGAVQPPGHTLVGGRHAHAEPVGDLPVAGPVGAQLQGLGVAVGGVDAGGAVRPRGCLKSPYDPRLSSRPR